MEAELKARQNKLRRTRAAETANSGEEAGAGGGGHMRCCCPSEEANEMEEGEADVAQRV